MITQINTVAGNKKYFGEQNSHPIMTTKQFIGSKKFYFHWIFVVVGAPMYYG